MKNQMINAPEVIVNIKCQPSLNSFDKNKVSADKKIKKISGLFDYYAREEKEAINMFEYYSGNLTKEKRMNIMLENGKFATKEDIDSRKNLYKRYIKNSHVWKVVISFPESYKDENINFIKLQREIMKNAIPMFFKKAGFIDIKNMSYQSSLHNDTDNYHFHFSFVEKKPNYKSNNKINYRQNITFDIKDINFLKAQILHLINKERIFSKLLKNTNNKINEINEYFNEDNLYKIFNNTENVLLEDKISKLYFNLKNYDQYQKIKFGSIKDKEIIQLTKDIKKLLFNNEELNLKYSEFKSSISEINNYFETVNKKLNLKSEADKTLINNKIKRVDNYISNIIINYVHNNKPKTKKITPEDILISIIKNKCNYYSNREITISYINSKKYKNIREVEKAIKNINYEMEKAKEEFSKLFKYEEYIDNALKTL